MSLFKGNDKKYTSGRTTAESGNMIKTTISSARQFYDPDYPPGTPEDFFEKSKIEEQINARLARRNCMSVRHEYNHRYPQQGKSSLCGPAAFIYALLEDRPDLYKQYITDLWNSGEAQLGNLHIKPSEGAKHPKNYTYIDKFGSLFVKVIPIDWISLASLRDSENKLFDYDSPDDKGPGVTMWGKLEKWFTKMGAVKVFDNIAISGSSLEDIVNLSNYVGSDYHVVTLIGAGMIGENGGRLKNHWIVWEGRPTVKRTGMPVDLKTSLDEEVELILFSWGEVDQQLLSGFTLRQFKQYLYGGMVFNRIP